LVVTIDAATVREQFQRFTRQWDDNSLLADYADLLRRYLSQPLSDSETAWAYRTLANVLACGERPAEAVDVHEAFERWLPGHSPRLSAKVPWYPAPEDSREPVMGPDELRLDFLSQSAQVATAYGALGRYADFVATFDNALAQLTPTRENVELRVSALGISLCASQIAGDFERAERCLPLMDAIANEETDADSAAELFGLILTWEIHLARARDDGARIAAKLQEGLSLLDRLERKGSSAGALNGFRHSLAHHLNQSGRYDLALPVLDAKLAAGGGSHGDHGYPWLLHAAAVWRVTRDRPRTLALLREARDHDPRDLIDDFRTSAFDGVQDDPDFLQAISRK
jgi:tetratricopeptide (TPR) repeat protein